MPGTTCTSSQPSSPMLSRICLVACTSSGTVMYSHFVIAATLSMDASNVARVAAEHVLDRSMPGPDLVVRYGDHADAVIDVFLPTAGGDEDPPSAVGPHPAPSVDSLGDG